MRLPSFFLGSLVVGAFVVSTPRAQACTVSPCRPARAFPDHGEIPANQILPVYWPARQLSGSGDAGVAAPRLFRMSAEGRVDVPLDLEPRGDGAFTLRPQEALTPGTQLFLEADAPACAPSSALRAELTVSEPRAAPSALGSVEANVTRATLQVAVIDGSCADVVDAAVADLRLVLHPDAQPFAAVIARQLLLDGVEVPMFSDALGSQTADARVYAVCQLPDPSVSPAQAVALGVHRARMRGTLPDGTVRETPEVAFELRCDGPAPAAGWEDIGVPFDRPSPDAGTAQARQDGGVVQASLDDSGCAASSARARGDAGWWVVVTLLLARVRMRQRRTRWGKGTVFGLAASTSASATAGEGNGVRFEPPRREARGGGSPN